MSLGNSKNDQLEHIGVSPRRMQESGEAKGRCDSSAYYKPASRINMTMVPLGFMATQTNWF